MSRSRADSNNNSNNNNTVVSSQEQSRTLAVSGTGKRA